MGSRMVTGVGDDDGGTAGGIEREAAEAPREVASMARHGGRRDWGRRRGSGTTTRVRDDDGVTASGIKAEGGDGAASREAVEAPREVASMAQRRGRRRRRERETWAA
jgi:hypothetical protein